MKLTPEQAELWREVGGFRGPSGDQAQAHAIAQAADSFRHVCALEGVEVPDEQSIRAEIARGREGKPKPKPGY